MLQGVRRQDDVDAEGGLQVTFSDGKTYIGSTHDVPHSPQHLSNNNFNGHLCVHFPISMEKAQSIGPYATSHQEAINEGWAATQKLKY